MTFHNLRATLPGMEKAAEKLDFNLKQGSPASAILRLLQRHGPSSIKSLESELGVSTNAVREQLLHLQAAGLVQAARQPHGAGRPAHLYALTVRGQQILPHGYDVLLNTLFEEIIAQDGVEKLDALLAGVSSRLSNLYGPAAPAPDPSSRLAAVQASLEQHHLPLTVVAQANTVRLQTWSCPYIAVAEHHPGVCAMEAQMLEQLVGQPIQVEQRIVDGHVGCSFLVDQRDSSSQK